MKKQLQSIVPAILMLLCSLTTYSQYTVGDVLEINMNDDPQQKARFVITGIIVGKTVRLESYLGAKKNVNIPQRVIFNNDNTLSYEVTAIGDNAFKEKQLRSVTIPNNIESIGYGAFHQNQLEEVTLGDNVTSIGDHAFQFNELTSVTIPNSVESIGLAAFSDNELTSVTLGEKVTSIGGHAFRFNELTSVTIPNSVESIGLAAFSDNELTSVTLGEKVTSIGDYAFRDNQLESVTLGENLRSIGNHAFQFNKLTSVTIPNNVESIGQQAFADNQLTSVTLGEKVTSIVNWAFTANQITHIRALGNTPPTLGGDNTFQNRGNIDVVVPTGALTAYKNHTDWADFKSITEVIVIGDTFTANHITYEVTALGSTNTVTATSYNTDGGTSVTIPQTVDHGVNTFTVNVIGNDAFKGKQLTELTFITPSNVTSIGVAAFRNNQLTSVTLGENVTSIGGQAFQFNELTSVTIPNNVESIGQQAFGNNQLTSVTLGENVTSIGGHTFQFNKLTSVTIPNNVESIGQQAFADNQLTSVTLGEKVTSIVNWAFAANQITHIRALGDTPPTLGGSNTFQNRGNIDVVVPRGALTAYQNHTDWADFKSITEVIEVGDTFTANHITYEVTALGSTNTVTVTGYNTNGGTSVTIPQTVDHDQNTFAVTSIGDNAFREKQLRSVTILDGVISIGNSAFRDNQLQSITIPNGVDRLENFTFYGNQLTHVNIPASVTSMGISAFRFNNLTQVTLPENIMDIGSEAFANNPIETVIALGNTPPTLGTDTFTDRTTIDVVVPKGNPTGYIQSVYKAETAWGTGFKSITEVIEVGDTFTANHITYEVTALGSTNTVTVTGYNTNGGTNVTIPQTVDHDQNTFAVTSIGDNAFREKQLRSVTILDGVISIGNSAFRDNQLQSITIPNGVDRLENFTFYGNQLTHVNIPASVTSMGISAFRFNNLTQVTLPENIMDIGSEAFANNPIETVIALGNTPPTLGTDTFTDRTTIDVVVPKGNPTGYIQSVYKAETAWGTGFKSITEVIEVGDTFTANHITYEVTALGSTNTVTATSYNTDGGTSVTIPQTVDHGVNTFAVNVIGNDAFKEKQLTELTFITPSNVTSIGIFAFQFNQLKEVTIPNNVESIGVVAFRNNQLTSVTLGENVTSIGGQAFQFNELTSVTIPNNVESIGQQAFADNQLTSVTLGEKVTSIVNWAFAANQITHIRALGDTPPTLGGSNTFQNRGNIDVVVPKGNPAGSNETAYKTAWGTGFKSIIEEGSTLSVNNTNNLKDFKIYPNPVQDIINIQLHNGQELKQVNIYNISGRHVYTGSRSQIDVSRLPSGMYLLEITTKTDARPVKRIIIE